MKIFQIALGILAAIGGFVDIGDLVFNVAAGAMFGYDLLWVVVVGVVGIIVYSEMCGRVAAVSQKAVFDAVRERVGLRRRSVDARRSADRDPADAGRRDRRGRDLLAAPLRPPVSLARPRRVVALAVMVWVIAVRVDRADLRLRRPLPARLRGRAPSSCIPTGERSRTASCRARHERHARSTSSSRSACSERR